MAGDPRDYTYDNMPPDFGTITHGQFKRYCGSKRRADMLGTHLDHCDNLTHER
jgi:hypothetical protein